ncbi:hypothetical protein NPIL_151781 [Nephila pilipes]|uniref:Uncharacterized protein n=1 Tax=Nephila pilipes TaxID=299642 RepID=A0A8X6TSA3_NEPPI|nr:hypothetical protein NPIL_151781 [Nephila pilipes]
MYKHELCSHLCNTQNSSTNVNQNLTSHPKLFLFSISKKQEEATQTMSKSLTVTALEQPPTRSFLFRRSIDFHPPQEQRLGRRAWVEMLKRIEILPEVFRIKVKLLLRRLHRSEERFIFFNVLCGREKTLPEIPALVKKKIAFH